MQAGWTSRPEIVRSAEGVPEGVADAKPRVLLIDQTVDALNAQARELETRGFEVVKICLSRYHRHTDDGVIFGDQRYIFQYSRHPDKGINAVVVGLPADHLTTSIACSTALLLSTRLPVAVYTDHVGDEVVKVYEDSRNVSVFQTGEWDAIAESLKAGIVRAKRQEGIAL